MAMAAVAGLLVNSHQLFILFCRSCKYEYRIICPLAFWIISNRNLSCPVGGGPDGPFDHERWHHRQADVMVHEWLLAQIRNTSCLLIQFNSARLVLFIILYVSLTVKWPSIPHCKLPVHEACIVSAMRAIELSFRGNDANMYWRKASLLSGSML